MGNDINKKISIDIEINTDGQQQISQYKTAFDSLRNSINGLANPLNDISKNISSLDKSIINLSGSLGKLGDKNEAAASSGKKFLTSLKEFKEISEPVKNAIELLTGSVESLKGALTAGLSVLLTYAPEIIDWVMALVKGKEAVDKAKLSISTMNSALESSDYSNAIKQMNELKINVGLAKKGFLDKKEVLKQYNDTVGKTMGKASDLSQVEDKLVKNGGAYIQMTLLKATAQLALQDAAKKAYETEQDSIKSDEDMLTSTDKTLIYIKEGLRAAAGMGTAFADAEIEKAEKAKQRRTEAIADAKKQSTDLLSIAEKYQTQAAAIAKQSGFDLFGGEIKPSDDSSQFKQKRMEALSESEKMLQESLTRQLQTTYEAYGKETMAENNRYQDELTRLNKLLNDKLISRQEYEKVSAQLEKESKDNIAEIINKYNQQDKERTDQVQNELAELQINGMQVGAAKQIAELNQQQIERNQVFDKIEAESVSRIKKLYNELNAVKAKDPKADTSELQKQLDTEFSLQNINCKKREELERQTAEAISKINDDEKKKTLDSDQKDFDGSKTIDAKLAANKKFIDDKYNYEIAAASGNADKIKELETKKEQELIAAINKIKDDDKKQQEALTKTNRKKIKDETIKDSKQLADLAFSMVAQGIKQQSDAKIAGLEKDKAAELSNNSLTSAQKLAIEQKYKAQENKIKAKAFKEQQEISIAQALINGAVAITKAEAQTGILGALAIPVIIAETALQVATIAKQKPPAMAKGGFFQSDGKGAVLPGYSAHDNTNAYLRSGEAIVVSEAMRVPWARNLVSAINVGFGGRDFSVANPGKGYAVGGIFTDGGEANRYYNQPVNDQKNLANSIAYQMINNFPPVYVDVKDINNQQNILAQTINRVNL